MRIVPLYVLASVPPVKSLPVYLRASWLTHEGLERASSHAAGLAGPRGRCGACQIPTDIATAGLPRARFRYLAKVSGLRLR